MMIIENTQATKAERNETMHHPHLGPGGHMPPHERKNLLHVEFCDTDWAILNEAFGDEDTAIAAAEIIKGAPPEIQILAMQLMNIIEEVTL